MKKHWPWFSEKSETFFIKTTDFSIIYSVVDFHDNFYTPSAFYLINGDSYESLSIKKVYPSIGMFFKKQNHR